MIPKTSYNLNLTDCDLGLELTSLAGGLVIRQKEGRTFILDPVRKKYVLLQPEEFVRQLLILWLTGSGGFHRNNIQVEKLIRVNGLSKRFDLVIYDSNVRPYILVECKEVSTPVSQETFDQIAVYNMALNAPYLLVSNGLVSYCVEVDHSGKSYVFMDKVPSPRTE